MQAHHVVIHVERGQYRTLIVDKLEDCPAAPDQDDPVILPHARVLHNHRHPELGEGGGEAVGLRGHGPRPHVVDHLDADM